MFPVILSGGAGTRLWPVSRASYPKQFTDLLGEALLARTVRRLLPLNPAPEGDDAPAGPRSAVGLVAAADTAASSRRILADLGLGAAWALFEPRGRNTAPALALLCHRMVQAGRGAEVVGSFHADHLIADEDAFRAALAVAERAAETGRVVTLGIRPERAETGYGYIEVGDEVVVEGADPAGDAPRALSVRGFREKPDAETAERYVASGRFLWNAGMFIFRVRDLSAHFERLMPELWAAITRVRSDLSNLPEVYDEISPESFDTGIMEHLTEAEQATVPCSIGWSDVGSWDELARLRDTPEDGRVAAIDSPGVFVFPHRDRVYGLVEVEDLLVVDTADALLIARKGASQRVKEVVETLAATGRREAAEHVFEERPWGRFEILRDTERFKSKVIRVNPGQRLSYQSHRHRAEHWVIVAGHPRVTLDGTDHDLSPGEHIHIPQGARHRIANPGDEPVELIEVQLGDYFGEDDIVRYEDDYDRS